ncbi:hypothetical protein TD95_002397, partial [Thielaviopsis punctulata]
HPRFRPPHAKDDEITRLASQPQHPLSLADLIRHGRPPLSEAALLSSANFALELLPIRLAHRIQALRSLPFIVVSNPHINKIYHNYMHSLESLLPFTHASSSSSSSSSSPYHTHKISSLADEKRFTAVLAALVAAHNDTIPILARGFLECKRYLPATTVTRFLDQHLRARIGTRLIAEQHLALHYSSHPDTAHAHYRDPPAHYIGVIDTALRPAETVELCASFVADICELRYGVRPSLVIDGDPATTFAHVPMHLDYMLTELLKNAFRATVENRPDAPVVVTVAPEPADAPGSPPPVEEPCHAVVEELSHVGAIQRLDDNVPGVTIRIRDHGGGISHDVLPSIWSYSFTTFNDNDDLPGSDGLAAIANAGAGGSSLAGLGYGLPLSRAYAEYFGGGIQVESLFGWGTDVYLRLKGIGRIQ